MDEAARTEVLRIARDTVINAVRGLKPTKVEPTAPELLEHRGAFVTLKNRGRLRGCIGQFVAAEPLFKIVQEMAVAAATRDPRFSLDRVSEDELPELHIEVSVLGPLEPISDPLDFELGVHGIHMKHGFATGCYLPQVATETGWSKEQFLSSLASGKAGLSPQAWRDPETELRRFTCEIVSE